MRKVYPDGFKLNVSLPAFDASTAKSCSRRATPENQGVSGPEVRISRTSRLDRHWSTVGSYPILNRIVYRGRKSRAVGLLRGGVSAVVATWES